mgnify:CR=1 FL=1
MTIVRRPQGGNSGKAQNINGQTSTKSGKKSPVRKVGKGAKKGRGY